eukprot:jgi/Orpsp1_1/1187819/evm.model.d7180000060370.1
MFKIKKIIKLCLSLISIFVFYKLLFVLIYSNYQYKIYKENNEINYDYLYNKNETDIKACIFILCQDKDQEKLIQTIHELEDTFPHKYPYILLNDVPFSNSFKTAISSVVSTKAHFGLIDKEQWSLPKGIHQKDVGKDLIPGKFVLNNRINYRHMC